MEIQSSKFFPKKGGKTLATQNADSFEYTNTHFPQDKPNIYEVIQPDLNYKIFQIKVPKLNKHGLMELKQSSSKSFNGPDSQLFTIKFSDNKMGSKFHNSDNYSMQTEFKTIEWEKMQLKPIKLNIFTHFS